MKLRIIHILSWLAAVMLLLASCGDRADSEQEKVLCPIAVSYTHLDVYKRQA